MKNQRLKENDKVRSQKIIMLAIFDNVLEIENLESYGNSYVWNILIPRLDFRTQLKMAQQNQYIRDAVEENAKYELERFKKKISGDKFMSVERSLHGKFPIASKLSF